MQTLFEYHYPQSDCVQFAMQHLHQKDNNTHFPYSLDEPRMEYLSLHQSGDDP